MTRDRCGYTYHVGRFPDIGAACCWRPVWGDHDCCIWHADVADKPPEVLVEFAPEPGERLDGAILRGTAVEVDEFVDCTLVGAEFTQADVSDTDFTGADLREAEFDDANAQGATFERANLEDALLRDVDLRSTCLDQARLDQAEFTASRINRETTFGDRTVYETRLTQTSPEDGTDRENLFESAIWTYRTLQRLAHRNARRNDTYEYYRREQDLRRRFAWDQDRYPFALKAEVSRWLTGYGHNPWRIVGASVLLIVVCAVLYPLTGGVQQVEANRAITFSIENPTEAPQWWIVHVLFKSLYFSIVTFATLGYGDFQPVGIWARTLAGLESLLGALLMALLVVALSRRITWLG